MVDDWATRAADKYIRRDGRAASDVPDADADADTAGRRAAAIAAARRRRTGLLL